MTEGIVTIKRPVARQLWLSTVSNATQKKVVRIDSIPMFNETELSAAANFPGYHCRDGHLRPPTAHPRGRPRSSMNAESGLNR